MGYAFIAKADYTSPINPEVESRSYDNYIVEKYVRYVPKETERNPKGYCSCLEYAKARRGITESLGYPNRIAPITQNPFVGAIGLTTEGRLGHAFVVEEVKGDWIRVSEANYERCKLTQRWLPIDSKIIRGYI